MVTAKPRAPERGDVVWLQFDPQAGYEQAGHRPGLVLSPKTYNQKVGLALICPITSRGKGYPFEVALLAGFPVQDVILSDQVKCFDWRARQARLIRPAPAAIIADVLAKLGALLS